MKIFYLLPLVFVLSSCSHYVQSIHKSFDRYDEKKEKITENVKSNKKRNVFDKNTHSVHRNKFYIARLLSEYNKSRSSSYGHQYRKPRLKKQRRKIVQTRFKAKDLNDKKNNESLWINNRDKANVDYFFTRNEVKGVGDIVIVYVSKHFKNEIMQELKKAFPALRILPDILAPPPSLELTSTPTPDPKKSPNPSPEPIVESIREKNDNIQEKISSIIIDEITDDHIIITGQKQLVYRNKKRTIQVDALVARKNIDENDIIQSDNFLDFKIKVVKK